MLELVLCQRYCPIQIESARASQALGPSFPSGNPIVEVLPRAKPLWEQ